MSVAEVRGGIPHVFRADITTTGRKHDFRQFAKYLQIQTADNPVKVYFTKADFDGDKNYIEVPVAAAATPWGYEGPAEVSEVWMKGSGGTAGVVLVAYLRRG